MTDDVHRDGSQPAGGSATPGATLAASRQRSGLSIEDVAAATRIRATMVRAIEKDDYELCGGEVYARGHIRSIAHVVGADAEGVVAAFDRRYGRQLPKLTVAPMSTIREPVREVTRKATKAAPKWPATAIAVLSLIVVLLAVSWVVGRRGPVRERTLLDVDRPGAVLPQTLGHAPQDLAAEDHRGLDDARHMGRAGPRLMSLHH